MEDNKPKDDKESDHFVSPTDNVVQTGHLILKAIQEKGLQANEVLLYEDLYPYLQEHSKHEHYKDAQQEAEHHLRNEGIIAPDPAGIRLTEVGFQALQDKKL